MKRVRDSSAAGATSEATAFIDAWRAREPEMAFAEVFCRRDQRARFAIWGALVCQWRQAALELSDARPTQIKCAWWAEEAGCAGRGAPRHPLTIALGLPDLPWFDLARAMLEMVGADDARPVDADAALATVTPLADAIAAMEGTLFGVPVGADASRAVAVNLLGARLRLSLETAVAGRLPLSLLARHGLTSVDLDGARGEPARRDWARELAAALPTEIVPASLYRRIRGAFDAALLGDYARGRNRRLPPLRALRLAWRAARRGGAG